MSRLVPCALAVACVALGCGEPPSLLDGVVRRGPAARDRATAATATDPWAPAPASGGAPADAPAAGLGAGLDVGAMVAGLGASLERPGPYEAPRASPGFAPGAPHWGVLALDGAIVERAAFSLTGGRGTELRALVARLRELARDPLLQGVVLRVEPLDLSLPDAVELRAALHALRDAGKRLACHVEGARNATYLVLAACDRIGLAPLGEVALTGPAAMPIHVKGLLDRLGVQADFLHVGAYKGAAEPLTREAPSPEMNETIGAILDRHYATMVEVVAAERRRPPAEVRALIDVGLFPAPRALAAGLVDDVAPFEAFRDGLAGGAWTRLELEPAAQDGLQGLLRLARFVGATPTARPRGPRAAVVYAVGDIVDGDGDGVLGARQQIAARTLIAALRALAADDDVRAVVLRIDSGGGSAQASELIWRAVADLRARKPVVVSMSDVAASGGYYIASGANRIFALPDTLTGSIGVVGGRIAPAGALAKLGVSTFPMGRGKRATLMASLGPWSEEDRATIQASMQAVYDVFVGRVAAGRARTPAEIEPLAQGRVWTGARALELGLVDELGGLDAALAHARTLGKVADDAAVELYPPAELTLRDLLAGWGAVHLPGGLDAALAGRLDAALAGQAGEAAAAARRLVALAASFGRTPVQAVAILPTIR